MNINIDYNEKQCVTCGCVYYVPKDVLRIHEENGTYFYCFNGHAQAYSKTASQKAKEKYDAELRQKQIELDNEKRRYGKLLAEQSKNTIKRKARRVTS